MPENIPPCPPENPATPTGKDSKSDSVDPSLMLFFALLMGLPVILFLFWVGRYWWQSEVAYSTRWRTRFHADGGQRSTVIADTVPR